MEGIISTRIAGTDPRGVDRKRCPIYQQFSRGGGRNRSKWINLRGGSATISLHNNTRREKYQWAVCVCARAEELKTASKINSRPLITKYLLHVWYIRCLTIRSLIYLLYATAVGERDGHISYAKLYQPVKRLETACHRIISRVTSARLFFFLLRNVRKRGLRLINRRYRWNSDFFAGMDSTVSKNRAI